MKRIEKLFFTNAFILLSKSNDIILFKKTSFKLNYRNDNHMRINFFRNLLNYTSPLIRNIHSSLTIKTGIVGLVGIAAYGAYRWNNCNYITQPYLLNKEEYKCFLDSIEYKELAKDPNLLSRLIEQGWTSNFENRSYVSKASELLIEKLFKDYVPSKSKILEIGSNSLFLRSPTNNRTYDYDQGLIIEEDSIAVSMLGSIMPLEHLYNTTFSDVISRKFFEEKFMKNSYVQFDATEGALKNPETGEIMTQNIIIGQNVADCIERSKLKRVAETAYEILDNGGKVILLADRPLGIYPFFSKFSDDDQVVFPTLSEPSGLKEVSKKTLEKRIECLQKDDREFISNFLKLNPAQRSVFIIGAISRNRSFIEFFNNFTSDIGKFHNQLISYEEDVKEAFGERFKVLECGYRKESAIVQKKGHNSKYNCIKVDPREDNNGISFEIDPNLGADEIKQQSGFHVIVLQKKE